MKVNKELVAFIREARKRGFDDFQIRNPLLKEGWDAESVELAFEYLKPKSDNKSKVEIYLDKEVLSRLEKRADKNLLNLHEQIEDILRRSTLNQTRKSLVQEKVDDKFITFFSRKGK